MCKPAIPEAPPPIAPPAPPSESAATNLLDPLDPQLRARQARRGGLGSQIRQALQIATQTASAGTAAGTVLNNRVTETIRVPLNPQSGAKSSSLRRQNYRKVTNEITPLRVTS